MTFFFKLIGYNLLAYSISLTILGFTTLLFTSLLIHKIFNNYFITVLFAVVFNYFPLHFLQTYTGHRYAIAAPLITASFYFIYSGYKDKSYFRIVIGAILAGLSVESAVMGKQYLIALCFAGALCVLFNFKKTFTRVNWNLTKLLVLGIIISLVPLILYVYYNPIYFRHESDLTTDFINTFKTYGLNGNNGIIEKYFNQFKDVMIGENTEFRWFSPDFVTIPFVYYIFLIPGLFIAFFKKNYTIIIMGLLPVAGSFVSRCIDMRFLHAVPFWIIIMSYTFYEITSLSGLTDINKLYYNRVSLYNNKNSGTKSKFIEMMNGYVSNKNFPKQFIWCIVLLISFCLLLYGLIPCINYVSDKSKDPFSIRLLPQEDVAVSRYVRDIVAGVPNPSTEMKWQELKKLQGLPEPTFDSLVCQKHGYAITHLFLQDYGDDKIMSFCGQFYSDMFSASDLLNLNGTAVESYVKNNNKDLKLVWEVAANTTPIIEKFKKLNNLGSDQLLTSQFEGHTFSFYILTIKSENIDKLKQLVTSIHL